MFASLNVGIGDLGDSGICCDWELLLHLIMQVAQAITHQFWSYHFLPSLGGE